MGVLSRTGDLVYAFRFLRLLTTPWEKSKAFELGLVDENGKKLKKATTPEEKSSYTVFHRLVFNIKRVLGKLPFGKSKLASYAAALFLIKEETGMSEESIKKVLTKVIGDFEEDILEESTWFQEDNKLRPGVYILSEDIASPITGEIIAREKTKVKVTEFLDPVGSFFNQNIYEVHHVQTAQKIYISNRNIKR
jgi:hypothetical protein